MLRFLTFQKTYHNTLHQPLFFRRSLKTKNGLGIEKTAKDKTHQNTQGIQNSTDKIASPAEQDTLTMLGQKMKSKTDKMFLKHMAKLAEDNGFLPEFTKGVLKAVEKRKAAMAKRRLKKRSVSEAKIEKQDEKVSVPVVKRLQEKKKPKKSKPISFNTEEFLSNIPEDIQQLPGMDNLLGGLSRLNSTQVKNIIKKVPKIDFDESSPKETLPIVTRAQLAHPSNTLESVLNNLTESVHHEYEKSDLLKQFIDIVVSWPRQTPKEISYLRAAYVGYAKSLNTQIKRQQAIDAILKAEDLLPLSETDPFLFFVKGTIFESVRQYAIAIQAFKRAIKTLPIGSQFYLDALNHRSNCLYHVGEVFGAEVDIKEVLQYTPNDLQARLNYSFYISQTNPERAIAELQFVLESGNTKAEAEARFRLSDILGNQKKYEQALDELDAVEKLDSRHPGLEIARQTLLENMEREQKEKLDDIDDKKKKKYKAIKDKFRAGYDRANQELKRTGKISGRDVDRQMKQRQLDQLIEKELEKKRQELLQEIKDKGAQIE